MILLNPASNFCLRANYNLFDVAAIVLPFIQEQISQYSPHVSSQSQSKPISIPSDFYFSQKINSVGDSMAILQCQLSAIPRLFSLTIFMPIDIPLDFWTFLINTLAADDLEFIFPSKPLVKNHPAQFVTAILNGPDVYRHLHYYIDCLGSPIPHYEELKVECAIRHLDLFPRDFDPALFHDAVLKSNDPDLLEELATTQSDDQIIKEIIESPTLSLLKNMCKPNVAGVLANIADSEDPCLIIHGITENAHFLDFFDDLIKVILVYRNQLKSEHFQKALKHILFELWERQRQPPDLPFPAMDHCTTYTHPELGSLMRDLVDNTTDMGLLSLGFATLEFNMPSIEVIEQWLDRLNDPTLLAFFLARQLPKLLPTILDRSMRSPIVFDAVTKFFTVTGPVTLSNQYAAISKTCTKMGNLCLNSLYEESGNIVAVAFLYLSQTDRTRRDAAFVFLASLAPILVYMYSSSVNMTNLLQIFVNHGMEPITVETSRNLAHDLVPYLGFCIEPIIDRLLDVGAKVFETVAALIGGITLNLEQRLVSSASDTFFVRFSCYGFIERLFSALPLIDVDAIWASLAIRSNVTFVLLSIMSFADANPEGVTQIVLSLFRVAPDEVMQVLTKRVSLIFWLNEAIAGFFDPKPSDFILDILETIEQTEDVHEYSGLIDAGRAMAGRDTISDSPDFSMEIFRWAICCGNLKLATKACRIFEKTNILLDFHHMGNIARSLWIMSEALLSVTDPIDDIYFEYIAALLRLYNNTVEMTGYNEGIVGLISIFWAAVQCMAFRAKIVHTECLLIIERFADMPQLFQDGEYRFTSAYLWKLHQPWGDRFHGCGSMIINGDSDLDIIIRVMEKVTGLGVRGLIDPAQTELALLPVEWRRKIGDMTPNKQGVCELASLLSDPELHAIGHFYYRLAETDEWRVPAIIIAEWLAEFPSFIEGLGGLKTDSEILKPLIGERVIEPLERMPLLERIVVVDVPHLYDVTSIPELQTQCEDLNSLVPLCLFDPIFDKCECMRHIREMMSRIIFPPFDEWGEMGARGATLLYDAQALKHWKGVECGDQISTTIQKAFSTIVFETEEEDLGEGDNTVDEPLWGKELVVLGSEAFIPSMELVNETGQDLFDQSNDTYQY